MRKTLSWSDNREQAEGVRNRTPVYDIKFQTGKCWLALNRNNYTVDTGVAECVLCVNLHVGFAGNCGEWHQFEWVQDLPSFPAESWASPKPQWCSWKRWRLTPHSQRAYGLWWTGTSAWTYRWRRSEHQQTKKEDIPRQKKKIIVVQPLFTSFLIQNKLD